MAAEAISCARRYAERSGSHSTRSVERALTFTVGYGPLASTRPSGQNAEMRQYPTDYRLWALLFWPAFIGIGFLSDPFDPLSRSLWGGLYRLFTRGGGPADEFGMIVLQTVAGIPLAIGAGWIGQALGQFVGLRLTIKPDKPQAADYYDAPPTP